MATIASLLATFIARLFSASVLRWLAMKTLLTTLFIIVLPIVLNNFISKLIDVAFNIINNYLGETNTIVVSFTGLASYILNEIYFTNWFSIILSAILLKITLRLIPIIKVVD